MSAIPGNFDRTLKLIENAKNNYYCLDLDDKGELQTISFLSHIWRQLKSIFIGMDQAFYPSNPLAIAQRVETLYDQHKDKLKKGQSLILQDFLTGFAKKQHAKECAFKIQKISQNIFNLVTVQPKLNIVNRAITHLNSQNFFWNAAAIGEAKDFFVHARNQLSNNKNIPLPEWYHATKTAESITSILRDRQVMQTPAIKGYGAYVSSNDEAGEYIGYGAWTIAFDGEFIENSTAAFFVPNPDHHLTGKIFNWMFDWPHASIWARVGQNLPINKSTVAYFIANDTNMPVLKKAADQFHPEIPRISREASKVIFSTLTQVGPKKELPYKWKWMEDEQKQPLPVVFK